MPTGAERDLPLDKIRLDRGTRLRKGDPATVQTYRENLRSIIDTPHGRRPVVYDDGNELVLADGFQRYEAHVLEGEPSMRCEVVRGTLREAVLFAAGSNAEHGRRRTPEELRAAVDALLKDEEWRKESDAWIAAQCRTKDRELVAQRRRAVCPGGDKRRRVRRGGQTYEMDATNLSAKAAFDEMDREPEFDELPEGARQEIVDKAEKRGRPRCPVHGDLLVCPSCGPRRGGRTAARAG